MEYTVFINEATGTRLHVLPAGKGFRSTELVPATEHSAPYKKERLHRTYAGVERLIEKRQLKAG